MRVRDGDNYVLVGSKGGAPKNPVWVYNLRRRVESQEDARHHIPDRCVATLPFRYCPLGTLKGGLRDVPGKAGLAPQVLAEEYSVLVKWKIAFGGLGDAVYGASSKHGSSTDH